MKKLSHSKSDTLLTTVDKKISETVNTNLRSFNSSYLKKGYIFPKLQIKNKTKNLIKNASPKMEVPEDLITSKLFY